VQREGTAVEFGERSSGHHVGTMMIGRRVFDRVGAFRTDVWRASSSTGTCGRAPREFAWRLSRT
jgi:hypothetical protein